MGHAGSIPGSRSFIAFDRAAHTAVVVLAHSDDAFEKFGMNLIAPAPARPETKVSEAVLDKYVGTYELSPKFSLVITHEDGSLFAQGTGQPKARLYAESETKFFFKAVDAQVTFTEEGRVLHQGGREVPAKRVK